MNYDILIIGSGPGGYVAGIKASQLGKKVGIIERAELGGICLNWGCIPAKSLLKSARILEYFKQASDYGINIEGTVNPDFTKIIERSREVAELMSQGVKFLMKRNNIDVINGSARLVNKNTISVTDNGSKMEYTSSNIILATGARTKEISGIKIDGVKVIGYKDALALENIPASMIVVGSGAIGTELAYFYQIMGTQVTLVEYKPNIAPLEDEEISRHLARGLKKRGVKVMAGVEVKSVDSNNDLCKVYITTKKGEEIIEAELVLSAVGITPNIENLGIEDLGIKTESGFIISDKFYRTNIEGIHAIGDIIPGPALAHVASAEGIICVEKISGLEPEPMNYDNIPSCIYTSPEVASLGLTEKKALNKGIDIKVGRFMFTASGKARASGTREGLVKLIFDNKTGKLIGAHLTGENVTEMIAELVVSIKAGISGMDIIKSVHPHPTMSEAIMEAAANAFGEAIHM